MKIETGTILISNPFMEDKRFEKTIILIVEANIDGIIGFILNKNTSTSLKDIIERISDSNININYGGPVDDTNSIFFIHQCPNLINGSKEVKNGVCWGGEMNDVVEGLNSGKILVDQIAFFLGYTGWEENQLKHEIKEGSWIIHNMDLTNFKKNLDWSSLLIQINEEYEIWASAPSDFHLN